MAIPWQQLVDSSLYVQAVTSRQPVNDARVEIISPGGAVVATLGGPSATHPGVISGSVSCDGESAVRWTCDLTISNDALVPESAGDLLHPLSHKLVRVWWRTLLADGMWGEVPVGTYYLDWTDVTDAGGATVTMSVRGSDPVAELARNTWDTSLDVSGMNTAEAVRQIVRDRAPWAKVAISPTDYTLPDEWEAGQPGGNPVDDILAIADAAGMVFYADRMGVLTLEPAPEPLSAPRLTFAEGPGARMTQISAEVDLDRIANAITLASSGRMEDESGNEMPPIVAYVEDDDPTSPLWVGHEHIYHRRFESDQIQSQDQANRMAARLLDDYRAIVDTVAVTHFARPELDPGDV